MKKDNFRNIKYITLIIIFILFIIILFSFLINIKDNKLIKDINNFIKSDTKILYISNEQKYSDYPIELFEKYDIDYLYINSTKLSKLEKTRIQNIINSKYLSNIIVIFNNGNIVDAIIEYENEDMLNKFLQINNIIPDVIGDNSNIIENVNNLLNEEYYLIYLPYKNISEVAEQDNILSNISNDYEFKYKKIDAYLLSEKQKDKLNSLLQISSVEDQIIILVKNNKIIGSVRGINDEKFYLEKLKSFKFIDNIDSNINYIDFDEFNNFINNNEKNIIIIGKDDCKYCENVKKTLNNISINYSIKVNYISVGKITSNISIEVKNKLLELGYKDGFTLPLTLITENKKLIDYVIGASNEQYFIDIFTENGIIK